MRHARTYGREEAAVAQLVLLESIIKHLREENQRLRAIADHDPLTGLCNRRRFEESLCEGIGAAHRYRGTMTLLMVDLDGMKRVNDTQGHAAGDEVLRAVAEVLTSSVRGCDVTARLGGDEFAVVMPATDALGAEVVAERIRSRVASLVVTGGLHVSASIGVAELGRLRDPRDAAAELKERADAALYAAKNAGKNRVVSHTSLKEAA